MSNTYRFFPSDVSLPSTVFPFIEAAITQEMRMHRTIVRNRTLPRFARFVSLRAYFDCQRALEAMNQRECSIQRSYTREAE